MIRFFAVACVVVSILADDYSNGYPKGLPAAISTAAGGKIVAATASGSGGFNRFGRIDARFDRFGLNRGFGLNQYINLPFNNPNFPYKYWRNIRGVSAHYNPNFPYKPWAYRGGVSPYNNPNLPYKPWAYPGGVSPYNNPNRPYKPWAYPGGVSPYNNPNRPYKPWAYPGGVSPYNNPNLPYKPWAYPGGVYNNPNLPYKLWRYPRGVPAAIFTAADRHIAAADTIATASTSGVFDEFAGIGPGGLGSSFRGRRLRKTY